MTHILEVGQVQIGEIQAKVYREKGSQFYHCSLGSLASLIGINKKTLFVFIRGNDIKPLLDKALNRATIQGQQLEPLQGKGLATLPDWQNSHIVTAKVKETGKNIVAISSVLSKEIIAYYAKKGNEKAFTLLVELAGESLEARFMRAFDEDTQENVRKLQDENNERLATAIRKLSKTTHNSWNLACHQKGLHPRHLHEAITMKVWGLTAGEARKLPMPVAYDEVWSDEKVGINHHFHNPANYELYLKMKAKTIAYKSGTLNERVERAYRELTKV